MNWFPVQLRQTGIGPLKSNPGPHYLPSLADPVLQLLGAPDTEVDGPLVQEGDLSPEPALPWGGTG